MHYLPENNDVMLGRCLAPPSCCPLQAAAPQPRWVVGRATDGQRQTTDGGERAAAWPGRAPGIQAAASCYDGGSPSLSYLFHFAVCMYWIQGPMNDFNFKFSEKVSFLGFIPTCI